MKGDMRMIDRIEVGKRIAALRKSLGYSQGVFAEKLNVTTQAVSKWETGLAVPDIEILLNISWMCRVSINYILQGDEDFLGAAAGIDRGIQRLNKFLICPQCKMPLSLKVTNGSEKLFFECEQGHKYDVIDDVVYFGTREIPGEQWSLWLKNYEHYLEEQQHLGLQRYQEGEVPCNEVKWRMIEQLRPRVILDIACGTGSGIKYIIQRINWPCMIIMTDLSHRILKWNHRFFSEELKNPYIDIVYLACDCANLPIQDNAIDLITSTGGFESMQHKMLNGVEEAYRVLKQGGSAVYDMSLVDDHENLNTMKWIELYLSLDSSYHNKPSMMRDISEWRDVCTNVGFSLTDAVKIYGEMPSPEDDVFPFENQVLRWMGRSAVISRK